MDILYFFTRNFTWVVYGLLFVSFLIGIKVAPKKQLHGEAGFSLDAMTSLKGIMALFVLFHHLSQKVAFHETGTLSIFEFTGFVFVGIFFFCSGFGLFKSFSTKPDYLKDFPRKRMLPIAICYFVMIAIYSVFYLIRGNDFTWWQWGLRLTGLYLINSQAWYVYVILLMYGCFYLIYKNEKTRKDGALLLLIIALAQGLFFIINGHSPWWLPAKEGAWWKMPVQLWFEGEWWVNSTVAFALGVLVAQKEKEFIEWAKRGYWWKLVLSFLGFALVTFFGIMALWFIGYWGEGVEGPAGIWKRGVCYIIQSLQVVMTCLFLFIFMQKFYVSNKFYKFYGKRSLEVYLLQELSIFSWVFLIQQGSGPWSPAIYKAGNWNVAAFGIIVFLTVSAGAIVYNLINSLLTKKLKK